MTIRSLLLAATLASFPIVQTRAQQPAAAVANTIYAGGDILTMVGDQPAYAEALAVKDGKILSAGAKADVLKSKGAATKVIDLGGRTLLPGFIEGHSHFINALSVATQANVYPPPFGPGNTIEGIVGALKKLQQEQNIKPGETIMAYGYDENALPADHQLSAADLDPHFPDNPVMVGHVSLHGAVLNSAAFKTVGAVQHRRMGNVRAQLAGWMLIASAPLSLLGVWLAVQITNRYGDGVEDLMGRVLGAALLFGAVGLIAKSLVRTPEYGDDSWKLTRRDKIAALLIGGFGLQGLGPDVPPRPRHAPYPKGDKP